MTFLQNKGLSEVGPIGPKDAKIVFIGEAPASFEFAKGEPFVGPAGGIFDHCLHAAGLIRSQVYITNLIKTRVKSIDSYFNQRTAHLTNAGLEWKYRLA